VYRSPEGASRLLRPANSTKSKKPSTIELNYANPTNKLGNSRSSSTKHASSKTSRSGSSHPAPRPTAASQQMPEFTLERMKSLTDLKQSGELEQKKPLRVKEGNDLGKMGLVRTLDPAHMSLLGGKKQSATVKELQLRDLIENKDSVKTIVTESKANETIDNSFKGSSPSRLSTDCPCSNKFYKGRCQFERHHRPAQVQE
jgi:hypothetical protein